jgi:hypothetical protein
MRVFSRIQAVWIALALALSMAIFAGTAHAGTLRVRDDAGALTSDGVQRLQSVLARAPFDGRLVVTTAYPDAQDLARFVHSLVTSPNVVVVGVDPEHRHVQVHFGSGAGVPASEWPAIERAGNDAFRQRDWAGGAAAIFAAAARVATGDPSTQGVPVEQTRPSLVGPGLLLLVVAGIVGAGIWLARRRSAGGMYPGPGYDRPPYGPAGYGPGYGQGYGPGYSGPGYPSGGGMGPLGGGIIGAGLGGLAGYELGKMEGEREARDFDRGGYDDRAGTVDDRGDDYDAGGGGSSWDDGGGSDGGGSDGGGFDGGGGDF